MEASISLDPSDEASTLHHPSGEALQIERLRPESLSELSDEALQQYILNCAEQFIASQKRWESTGCFAAIGDRDGWWHSEADALREMGNRPGVSFA